MTDLNLMRIKARHRNEVTTMTFTKRQEGVEGADWEWWFTGPSHKWFGCRVQAKVINVSTETYDHLHYRNRRGYQAEALIKRCLAHSHRPVPLYVLYTTWRSDSLRLKWRCGSFPEARESYGCSVIGAQRVIALRALPKATELVTILPYLIPWHCLVCCQGFRGTDLPSRVQSIWMSLLRMEVRQADGERESTDARFGEELHAEPPRYVRELQSRELRGIDDPALARITVFTEIGD